MRGATVSAAVAAQLKSINYPKLRLHMTTARYICLFASATACTIYAFELSALCVNGAVTQ